MAASSLSPSRRLLAAFALFGLVATPPLVTLAANWAEKSALGELRQAADNRLDIYSANIRSELERYRLVPLMLAKNPEVVDILRAPPDAEKIDRLNHKLDEIDVAARASAVYLMDAKGDTVASSNWAQPDSFVGKNFAFRPYFREAMRGKIGRFYGLGTTSNVPGYYIGVPVQERGRILGAAVVKMGIDQIEEDWAHAIEHVLVTDENGIVFLTNVPSWRFNSLYPLAEARRQEIKASRKYSDEEIGQLPLRGRQNLHGNEVLTFREAPGGGVPAPGHGRNISYLVQNVELPEHGWTVHVMLPTKPVRERMFAAMLIAFLGMLTLVSTGYYFLYRRLMLKERLALQERVKTELESRVSERTSELLSAYRRLEHEMGERLRAEQELIQAAKLAAIGQMAAGITHEINQPLAALRSYSDNAKVLLERGRIDEAGANLDEISALTERMAQITRQLKGFARKPAGELKPISAKAAIEGALALLAPQVRKDCVEIERRFPDEDILVLAEEVRLQQVLVNLFRNALDAMRDGTPRRLTVSLERDGEHAVIKVADSGQGIAEAHLAQLFHPFFTTKRPGEGLGLGLSISHGIVQGFGGALEAANQPEGGAVFTVRLRFGEAA